MAIEDGVATIEIRVERVAQLFDTLDPLPVPQRDLAKTTEDFIVGWARELPHGKPLCIVVHLPLAEAAETTSREVRDALHNYFRYRADRIGSDIKELFRVGRLSLAIGLVVLGACVTAGGLLAARFGDGYINRFFNEGLIILGWVANWRPIEIFLYDWWPLARQRTLYQRLAAAEIVLKPASAPGAANRPAVETGRASPHM